MSNRLRALVIGAGWAGEGHTRALQGCGVEVAAICARRPEVVREVAARLGVAEAATDWRETRARLRPDIVTWLRRLPYGHSRRPPLLVGPGRRRSRDHGRRRAVLLRAATAVCSA